ncbi:hypothetical protein CSQ88_21535 [Iodobacter sp. BJB302]|nr:hypothetical protein CSQ88_21535 [Iodobacter sp. BJB302]
MINEKKKLSINYPSFDYKVNSIGTPVHIFGVLLCPSTQRSSIFSLAIHSKMHILSACNHTVRYEWLVCDDFESLAEVQETATQWL